MLEHRDGHYVVQDWKGNVCEISDEFDVTYLRNAVDFVTRRWIKCPVETRSDWEDMKTRYDADDPARLGENFDKCGFEGLCMMTLEQPELVAEMAEFWKDFADRLLERICERTTPDVVGFDEDMAYKEKAMISPAMTRDFCLPSWRAWCERLTTAGVPVIDMDSDGYVGELIPLWIEAGINVCDDADVANFFNGKSRHKKMNATTNGL